MERNIEELRRHFETVKAREESKLDDNALYSEARENIKYFDKMLEALERMELMIVCDCDYCA